MEGKMTQQSQAALRGPSADDEAAFWRAIDADQDNVAAIRPRD
jgi:hypothetical protein